MRVIALIATFALMTACQGATEPSSERAPAGQSSPPPNPSPTPAETSTAPEPTGTTSDEAPAVPDTTDRAVLNARLIEAAWDNDLDRVRRLVAAGANVNAKDETEQSAYLISTSEGYLRLLDLTLRNGADVSSLDSFNGTGLIRAAERGHADVVGRLLQTPIAVDHVNRLGWTALNEAIVLGAGSRRYVDTVRLLVAGGANVQRPAEGDGRRPLEQARAKGFDAIATTLRAAVRAERARRVDANRADRMLLDAARRGDADGVATALRAGARLEARDQDRRTPLLLAAINDHVGVARLLVRLGADPDAQDYRDDSAWLVTGVTGSVRMLEALLPAHPDLALTNRFEGTSVIPASERGHVDYVRRVVHTDIDVNHVNDLGWTAMLEAIILGDGSRPYQRIIRILIAAGADPSIADGDGVTPLEHARSRGYDQIARMLRRA